MLWLMLLLFIGILEFKFVTYHTPYSKMAANELFFCLHVYEPSLPHFYFKILLFFIHVDEAKRAN